MRAAPQRPKSRVRQARRHSSKVLIVGVLALTSAATSAQTGRLETAFAGESAATDGANLQAGDEALNELVAALFPEPGDDADPGDRIYLAQAGITLPGTGQQGVGGFPSLTPTTPSPYQPLAQGAVRQRPFVASIAVTETLTNNVNLAPAGSRQGDLVSQIVPQVVLNERGPYSSFRGFLAAPILLYVRTAAENDKVYPNAGLLGNVEAVPHFFFVEGAVSVEQQFLSPFGAQPADLSNATQNRYTSEVYRISPYILHTTPGDYRYEIRNNNVWTNSSGTAVTTSNAYYDQWLANIASPVAPYGWVADYVGDWVTFKGQRPLVMQVGRGELVAQVEPEFQVTAIGGYEHNSFTLTSYSGPIYGASARWRPTPRANLVARWEHRFFGPSYLFAFQNHGPLSVVDLRYSRNITTYPQQYLSLPAGADVPLLLNSIFSSSIPDPEQRQTFIDNLIEQNGLPTTLTSPVNLYNEQINLVEQARATVGLLGARNALLATGFYVRYQPITASGMAIPPSLLFPGNNSTQKGVTLTWGHNLTPLVTVAVTGTLLRTTLDVPPFGTTKQGNITLKATRFLSTDTRVFIGARYQKANSDFGVNYNEAAIFAGLNYVFR
jgi:uncharacterized protein (PEP-CTERM system associated)